MKKLMTALCCALMTMNAADAKIWRVNNTLGASADFTTPDGAVSAAAAGDTIHIEQSLAGYGLMTLNKRLVVRGPGYFLSETVSNPKTQHNKEWAFISSVTCSNGSKGSIIEGVGMTYCYLNDSLVTIQRCYVDQLNLSTAKDVAGDTIRNNYFYNGIYLNSGSYKTRGLFLYNNIFKGTISLTSSLAANADGFAINNTFVGNSNLTTMNFIYQNNIFLNSGFTGTFINANTFLNNVAADGNLPAGNGNVRNVNAASLFVGGTGATAPGYSSDGRYMLKAGSPAIGAGVLNGQAVDCGAFGGPAPYVLSGMPQMPSIYSISLPAQINAGTTSINVSVSAAAH